jgi:hypothetical protein
MEGLKKYLEQIRRTVLESESYFSKDPVDSLDNLIENPSKIKTVEKDFKKFDNFSYFLSVLNKSEPVTKTSEFKNMVQYVKEVLLNSLDVSEEEGKFLATSICLKNIHLLKKSIIQKFLSRFVSKYRKNKENLSYLENILIDLKESPENIRKLISISLIQYIRNKLGTKVVESK